MCLGHWGDATAVGVRPHFARPGDVIIHPRVCLRGLHLFCFMLNPDESLFLDVLETLMFLFLMSTWFTHFAELKYHLISKHPIYRHRFIKQSSLSSHSLKFLEIETNNASCSFVYAVQFKRKMNRSIYTENEILQDTLFASRFCITKEKQSRLALHCFVPLTVENSSAMNQNM